MTQIKWPMQVIPLESESVSVTVAAAAIPDGIKKLTPIAKKAVLVNVNANGAWLVAHDNEANTVVTRLPSTDFQGEGSFLIEPDTITPVCTNRKGDLTFTYVDGALSFKAVKGKYAGTLASKPLIIETVVQINDVLASVFQEASLLSSETYTALTLAGGYARITDVFDSKNQLRRYISTMGNKVVVSSFDNYHMVRAEATVFGDKEVAPFKMSITDSYFDYTSSLMGDSDKGIKFVVTDHTFAARSPESLLFMPPTQTKDEYEVVKNCMDQVSDFDLIVDVNAGSLQTVVTNCCAVYNSKSTIRVVSTADSLQFSIESEFGSVEDTISVVVLQGKASFSLEPRSFLDLVNLFLSSATIRLSIKSKNSYRLDYADDTISVSMLGSLHSDE